MAITLGTRRRQDIALLLFLYSGVSAWQLHTDVQGVARAVIAATAVYLVVGVGVWFAREWARWACGVVAVLMVAKSVIALLPVGSIKEVLGSGADGLVAGTIGIAIIVALALLWAWIARYCFRRSTQALWAEVREARARARAVPR